MSIGNYSFILGSDSTLLPHILWFRAYTNCIFGNMDDPKKTFPYAAHGNCWNLHVMHIFCELNCRDSTWDEIRPIWILDLIFVKPYAYVGGRNGIG